jgi:hypothetical protein
MSDPESIREQRARRLQELSRLARRRYLDRGGDPLKSSDENQLTDEEREEFQTLLHSVFDRAYLDRYRLKKPQNPRERSPM